MNFNPTTNSTRSTTPARARRIATMMTAGVLPPSR